MVFFNPASVLYRCCCYVTQGAEEAGDRVATLDVFKNAQNIKVDPDKPLQQARYVTLKVYYVSARMWTWGRPIHRRS